MGDHEQVSNAMTLAAISCAASSLLERGDQERCTVMKDRENAEHDARENGQDERKAEHDGVERDLVQPRKILGSELDQEPYPELGEPEPEQAAEQSKRETLRE